MQFALRALQIKMTCSTLSIPAPGHESGHLTGRRLGGGEGEDPGQGEEGGQGTQLHGDDPA